MDPTNLPQRTTPHWSLYQRECFERGTTSGELPPFNTDPEQLEILAKERLSAGDYKILPRMLVDTNKRDTTVKLFGKTLSAPICISPIGINKIYHPEGELPVARVAGELGLPYTLSTAGSVPIEDAGENNKLGAEQGVSSNLGAKYEEGLRYFQLYLPHDPELARSLLTRAHKSGFEVCMMTLDTDQLAWRHNDISLANYGFYKGIGNDLGFSDPHFQKTLKKLGIDEKKDPKAAGRAWIDSIWHGKAHDWNKIPEVIKLWKEISGGKPFLLKGIQTVEDAKKARDLGCDGIVVSNHAGRQVDGAIGSLEALPGIVETVGQDLEILFDSGIRSASDAFKALALGAKAIMIGRLWVYGLSIAGEMGVRHVLRSFLAEFDILMNVAGYNSIKDIDRSALKSKIGTSSL